MKSKYVNVPLECLGTDKKQYEVGVDLAEGRDISSVNLVSTNIQNNQTFSVTLGLFGGRPKTATEVQHLTDEQILLFGERGLVSVSCSGLCQPHRDEVRRKHVDSKLVEPKQLTG